MEALGPAQWRYYVPSTLGGKLQSFEEAGARMRVVSRRNPTLAITHAISLLGTGAVWLVGDMSQQRTVASSVLDGEQVSVALTEPAAACDLLAMTTAARQSGDGYHLTGEKWLANGLRRHRFVVVYARTSERGGPRGFSLFLVDRQEIPDGIRASEGTPPTCLRGADMSAGRFDVQLPRSALLGPEGSGFEVILKALQSSRLICGALSLGVLDASFETVLRFALRHELDGQPVAMFPPSQKLLVEAWAELLICDSVTGLALRGLHAVPCQASVHSAVVKYVVPTLAELALQKLSIVYGARYYLLRSDDGERFPPISCDHLTVHLFDGSAQVNLFSLSQQLRRLIFNAQAAEVPEWARYANQPDDVDWSRLALSASGQDAVLAGFEAACRTLRNAMQQCASDETRRALELALAQLSRGREELFRAIRQLSPGAFAAGDPRATELARRYCVVSAASAVLADWQLNREVLTSTLAQPAVVAVVLHRLAAQLEDVAVLPTSCYRECFAALVARREHDGQCALYALPTQT